MPPQVKKIMVDQEGAIGLPTISKTSRLRSQNLKDIWTPMRSLKGSKWLKGSLSTKMYLKTDSETHGSQAKEEHFLVVGEHGQEEGQKR